MAINLKPRYKNGDRVRFRTTSVSVPSQYLPKGIVGTVKACYLEPYGVSMREHVDIEFMLADPDNFAVPTSPVEFRKIPADQMEPA